MQIIVFNINFLKKSMCNIDEYQHEYLYATLFNICDIHNSVKQCD